jgi:hypothetical protein
MAALPLRQRSDMGTLATIVASRRFRLNRDVGDEASVCHRRNWLPVYLSRILAIIPLSS